jgi:hypothetical protein
MNNVHLRIVQIGLLLESYTIVCCLFQVVTLPENWSGTGFRKAELDRVLKFALEGVVLTVVCCVGIIGNIINIIVLSRKMMVKKSNTSIYLTALAIVDIIVTVATLPISVGRIMELPELSRYQGFYAYFIVYIYPCQRMFHDTANWITVALTVERYIAISLPLFYKSICSPSRARLIIFAIFVIIMALSIEPFFRLHLRPVLDPVTKEYKMMAFLTDFGKSNFSTTITHFIHLIISFLAPFLLLSIFNGLLIRSLHRAAANRKALSASGQAGRMVDKQHWEITRLVITLVALFLLLNLGVAVASTVATVGGVTGGTTIYTTLVFTVFMRIANVTSLLYMALHVFLYSAASESFRNELKAACCGSSRDLN